MSSSSSSPPAAAAAATTAAHNSTTTTTTSSHKGSSVPEVQDTLARIASHRGVLGVMILHAVTRRQNNNDHHPASAANSSTITNNNRIIHSTWPEAERERHAHIVAQLVKQARLLFPIQEKEYDSNTSSSSTQQQQEVVEALGAEDQTQDEQTNKKDALSFLTIRSKQREILVAPDGEYLLVVLQNPHAMATTTTTAASP